MLNYLYNLIVTAMPIMVSAYDAGYYNIFNVYYFVEAFQAFTAPKGRNV